LRKQGIAFLPAAGRVTGFPGGGAGAAPGSPRSQTRQPDSVTPCRRVGSRPVPRLVRALAHRNFRLFFGGQTISLVGTWMTRVATSWLAYRLTGSELMLGLVGFCGQIPALLLAPVAGVIVDRVDHRRLLVLTQALLLIQAAVLAVLTLLDVITVTQLLALQLVQGAFTAFDMPARQAFVVEMVDDRRDLPNAIALNSIMVNSSRVIGPSVGGALIALVGEGWCFGFDALSYVAVIASLLAMTTRRQVLDGPAPPVLDELRRGWRYVVATPPIRTALALVAVTSTLGMPYTVLMPAVAAETLHGGPDTLGWLMGAVGVGALGGGVYLASRETEAGLARVIAAGTLFFGGSLVAFSLSNVLWLALVVAAATGVGFIVQLAATNTLLQTTVEQRFRGRVMSFYTMAILGTLPIGSLLAGAVADRVGAPLTIGVGGVVCLVAGARFMSGIGPDGAVPRRRDEEAEASVVPNPDVA